MTLIPTEKSTAALGLKNYTILIHGEPKIGKSSFCAEIPKSLFLDFDSGLGGFEVHKTPVIEHWDQVEIILKELESPKNKEKYDVIIIDTLERMYQLCLEHVCRKLNVTHPGDKGAGYGKGWNQLNTTMYQTIRKLAVLGYGRILISHTKELDVGEPVKIKYVPSLGDSIRNVITSMSNMIFFFRGEKKLLINKETKEVKHVTNRVIRTRSSVHYEAGCQAIRGNILPDPIPLDYELFMKELDGLIS